MSIGSVIEIFFTSITVEEKGMHNDIAWHNLIFDKLEWGFRYMRIKTDESGYVEESGSDGEQDDSNIQIEDA
jgi:hypothetical protein